MGAGSKILCAAVAGAVIAGLALFALSAPALADGQVEAIADGGFENSTCHDVDTEFGPVNVCEEPAWTSGWQASICGQPACAVGADDGNGFLRLGGSYMTSNPMTGIASQTVDLPPGPKTLTFAIRVAYENPVTSAAASVEVDGEPVFGMSSGEVSAYANESVDMTGYSGEHQISFKATCSYDVAMPAMRTCDGFSVDDVSLLVTPPELETTFGKVPPARTARHRARFTFTSNVEAATFRCRLDGEPLPDCASPLRVEVGKDRHRLSVRAVDGPEVEGTPAQYRWRVTKRR